MYGLLNQRHLADVATEVCDCLGYGANGTARDILMETAGAETIFGTYKDETKFAGMGITQFDKSPFYDVRTRASVSDRKRIEEYFNIDIDLVDWKDLRYNPLLAMLFTRLKYKKITAEIPETLMGRAEYWKEHYNTKLGKGTTSKYLAASKHYGRLSEISEIRYG
ncbi:hypothetical protein HN803_02960 [candidate division WWE3 bacterium]|jgi:hypothetical protein|nr:hypothetical protein [candidate division WWE3 bacterium]